MLKLVKGNQESAVASPLRRNVEAEQHHIFLLKRYYQSHQIRGHCEGTVEMHRRILEGWFGQYGSDDRPMYTWEAMVPIEGRERIRSYASALVETGLTNRTIRQYLLTLNQYFSFVLDHPYVEIDDKPKRIDEIYGALSQPISEFDLPVNSGEAEAALPLEPERIYEFLALLHQHYLQKVGCGRVRLTRGRNYTMAVIAAESGLRANELVHLHVSDLFFDSNRIQTRFAKGKRGSGKRSRTTLFPPFARDTMRYYLKNFRPHLVGSGKSDILFLSHAGKMLSARSLSRITDEFINCAKKTAFPILDHMSWHWFRRIFATRFIERFPDKLGVLLELLGHSNMSSVHRYIRHSEAWMDAEIQNVLEKKVGTWQSSGI